MSVSRSKVAYSVRASRRNRTPTCPICLFLLLPCCCIMRKMCRQQRSHVAVSGWVIVLEYVAVQWKGLAECIHHEAALGRCSAIPALSPLFGDEGYSHITNYWHMSIHRDSDPPSHIYPPPWMRVLRGWQFSFVHNTALCQGVIYIEYSSTAVLIKKVTSDTHLIVKLILVDTAFRGQMMSWDVARDLVIWGEDRMRSH
jgi:hypothetical protein